MIKLTQLIGEKKEAEKIRSWEVEKGLEVGDLRPEIRGQGSGGRDRRSEIGGRK